MTLTSERLRASRKRVSAVEPKVEGEKLVARYILEQTRHNSDDLAAIKARLNAHDARFDRIDSQLSTHDRRLDRLEAELRSLRRDLPGIIAETLREEQK